MNKELEEILEQYRNLVVVGGNWGDEGKGKVIDLVMSRYDQTVRFSGGANAGHTVYTPSGKKLVSHLIPCGLAQGKECIMGRGELVDLSLFLKELDDSKKVLGTELPNIWLDEMSPLWTPWHSLLEAWLEKAKGADKVGTTGKGIGPLEGLYKLRMSPLVGHVLLPKEKIIVMLEPLRLALLPIFNEMVSSGAVAHIPTVEEVADAMVDLSPNVKQYITDTSFLLSKAVEDKKRILFEGAQALGLDSYWGTYPFVSSGNSAAFGAAAGTGLPMGVFDATLMVVKTLPTRVGGGPFPSEMWERMEAMSFAKEHGQLFADKNLAAAFLSEKLEKINSGQASGADMSQYFQVLGDERGATTGRGRSVGYLDIPWLQYAIRINGPKWLALTRFDMLSKVRSLPVVVGYKLDGNLLGKGQLPPPWKLGDVEVVTEEWECWEEDIFGTSSEESLPHGARKFLLKLEKSLGVPILLVGTGPAREAMVIRGS